jgi:DNA-binding response OmpR family regulator
MKPVKILLVDYSKKDMDSLSVLLEGEGYHVSSTNSGHEGIKRAEQETFDLIITDLDFPDIKGKDLVFQLRKVSKKNTPLLILSRQDEVEDIEDFFQHGVADYIVKPPRFSYLLNKIKRLSNREAVFPE